MTRGPAASPALPRTISVFAAAPTPPRGPSWPGGLDPRSLRARPAWHRFLPRGRVEALLRELSDDDLLALS